MFAFNKMRKWILLILLIGYAFVQLLQQYHTLTDSNFKLFATYIFSLFMPWGNNYYTLQIMILCLGLDLLLDLLPSKLGIIKYPFRVFTRSVLIIALIAHLFLVSSIVYFMWKGGM
jgi:hypothetical protein